MAEFPGMTHVALTVTDLAVSVPWYERLLGLKPVLDEDTGSYHHTVYLLPGGMILGLHQHRQPHPGAGGPDRFDEHRVGLDHLSFGVANRAELQVWPARLEELGIRHGEIVDAHYGSGLSFRDPDNIALEIFAPPG
jgi:glyoxylase I family protein